MPHIVFVTLIRKLHVLGYLFITLSYFLAYLFGMYIWAFRLLHFLMLVAFLSVHVILSQDYMIKIDFISKCKFYV